MHQAELALLRGRSVLVQPITPDRARFFASRFVLVQTSQVMRDELTFSRPAGAGVDQARVPLPSAEVYIMLTEILRHVGSAQALLTGARAVVRLGSEMEPESLCDDWQGEPPDLSGMGGHAGGLESAWFR